MSPLISDWLIRVRATAKNTKDATRRTTKAVDAVTRFDQSTEAV